MMMNMNIHNIIHHTPPKSIPINNIEDKIKENTKRVANKNDRPHSK